MYKNSHHGIQIGAPPQSHRKFPQFKTFNTPLPLDTFVKDAKITNEDFKVICEQYKADPSALLFLDPPYANCDNRFYSSSPTTKDVDDIFEYLAEFIPSAKCRVMLVVNNCLLTRVLFKGLIKHTYNKTYSVSQSKLEHIIICNDS